jgi:hypothetical protein
MQRDTNKKRAERIAETSALRARYVTEEGLEIHTGISAKTFNALRGKTPDRWSAEQLKNAIARGEMVGPPYRELGGKRIYDLEDISEWMSLFPKRGILPKPEELAGKLPKEE